MKIFTWIIDFFKRLDQMDNESSVKLQKLKEEEQSPILDGGHSFSFNNRINNVPVNTGEKLFKMMESRNRDL